jgi:acylphosphatase
MSDTTKTRRWLIVGKVQGVGFRYFARREAETLGLAGRASNHPDGTVDIVARGSVEALDAFEAKLAIGPPAGRVDDCRVVEPSGEVEGDAFHIEF